MIKHNENLNCFQEIVAYVAQLEGLSYELMLSRLYSFHFKKKENELLGNCISSNSKNSFDFLEDYHGIKIDFFRQSKNLYEKLTNYKYIFANIDTFYCPWDKNYNVLHNENHTVIVDDVSEHFLIVTDPFYEKSKSKLSIDALREINGIDIVKPYQMEDEYFIKKTIRDTILNMLLIIREIKEFAQEIISIDWKNEMDKNTNPWHAPIVFNMGRIALARRGYATFLEYVDRKYNLNLDQVIQNLYAISDSWDAGRGRLIKCFVRDNMNDLYVMQKRLMNLYEMEKAFCFSLYSLVE